MGGKKRLHQTLSHGVNLKIGIPVLGIISSIWFFFANGGGGVCLR